MSTLCSMDLIDVAFFTFMLICFTALIVIFRLGFDLLIDESRDRELKALREKVKSLQKSTDQTTD